MERNLITINRPALENLQKLVEKTLYLNQGSLKSPTKEREIADARKIFAYIAKNKLNHSDRQIAMFLQRDRSTVITAINECIRLAESNEAFKKQYELVLIKFEEQC